MPTQKKIEEVERLQELLTSNDIVILTDHTGLNVEEINDLRAQLKENGAFMRVAKNRLIALARQQAELMDLGDLLEGPTSLVLGQDDPVGPSKVIKEFMDDIEKPAVKAILIGDTLYDLEKFEEIAAMPGLDELRAKLVGSIASPINGLVFTMSGLMRGLVVALNGVAEKKREESA